jgi:hypothetical protein
MRIEAVAKRTDHSGAELAARHFDAAGRLATMPAKPARRLLVLQRIAAAVPTGVELDEYAINNLLRPFDDDVATLRRYLVNTELLERISPGRYVRRESDAR